MFDIDLLFTESTIIITSFLLGSSTYSFSTFLGVVHETQMCGTCCIAAVNDLPRSRMTAHLGTNLVCNK